MSYDFQALTGNDTELDQVTQLFYEVWPESLRLTREYIKWLYLENPEGSAIGFNAYQNGQLAGHYTVIPMRAYLNGISLRAALSLNTAVGKDHRGKGLFKTLAEKTYALAADFKIDHVVGIANANSTPGFTKSLGFQLVTPLDTRILLGRPSFVKAETEWRRQWTRESLAWRLRAPGATYWRDPAPSSCLLGKTKYTGVSAVLKVEDQPSLLNGTSLAICRSRRPVLWFGKSPALCMPPSLSVPRRLRPSPFNMIFRDLSGHERKLNPAGLHFEAVDFDVM